MSSSEGAHIRVTLRYGSEQKRSVLLAPPADSTFNSLFQFLKQKFLGNANFRLVEVMLTGVPEEGEPVESSLILDNDWPKAISTLCFSGIYFRPPAIEFFAEMVDGVTPHSGSVQYQQGQGGRERDVPPPNRVSAPPVNSASNGAADAQSYPSVPPAHQIDLRNVYPYNLQEGRNGFYDPTTSTSSQSVSIDTDTDTGNERRWSYQHGGSDSSSARTHYNSGSTAASSLSAEKYRHTYREAESTDTHTETGTTSTSSSASSREAAVDSLIQSVKQETIGRHSPRPPLLPPPTPLPQRQGLSLPLPLPASIVAGVPIPRPILKKVVSDYSFSSRSVLPEPLPAPPNIPAPTSTIPAPLPVSVYGASSDSTNAPRATAARRSYVGSSVSGSVNVGAPIVSQTASSTRSSGGDIAGDDANATISSYGANKAAGNEATVSSRTTGSTGSSDKLPSKGNSSVDSRGVRDVSGNRSSTDSDSTVTTTALTVAGNRVAVTAAAGRQEKKRERSPDTVVTAQRSGRSRSGGRGRARDAGRNDERDRYRGSDSVGGEGGERGGGRRSRSPSRGVVDVRPRDSRGRSAVGRNSPRNTNGDLGDGDRSGGDRGGGRRSRAAGFDYSRSAAADGGRGRSLSRAPTNRSSPSSPGGRKRGRRRGRRSRSRSRSRSPSSDYSSSSYSSSSSSYYSRSRSRKRPRSRSRSRSRSGSRSRYGSMTRSRSRSRSSSQDVTNKPTVVKGSTIATEIAQIKSHIKNDANGEAHAGSLIAFIYKSCPIVTAKIKDGPLRPAACLRDFLLSKTMSWCRIRCISGEGDKFLFTTKTQSGGEGSNGSKATTSSNQKGTGGGAGEKSSSPDGAGSIGAERTVIAREEDSSEEGEELYEEGEVGEGKGSSKCTLKITINRDTERGEDHHPTGENVPVLLTSVYDDYDPLDENAEALRRFINRNSGRVPSGKTIKFIEERCPVLGEAIRVREPGCAKRLSQMIGENVHWGIHVFVEDDEGVSGTPTKFARYFYCTDVDDDDDGRNRDDDRTNESGIRDDDRNYERVIRDVDNRYYDRRSPRGGDEQWPAGVKQRSNVTSIATDSETERGKTSSSSSSFSSSFSSSSSSATGPPSSKPGVVPAAVVKDLGEEINSIRRLLNRNPSGEADIEIVMKLVNEKCSSIRELISRVKLDYRCGAYVALKQVIGDHPDWQIEVAVAAVVARDGGKEGSTGNRNRVREVVRIRQRGQGGNGLGTSSSTGTGSGTGSGALVDKPRLVAASSDGSIEADMDGMVDRRGTSSSSSSSSSASTASGVPIITTSRGSSTADTDSRLLLLQARTDPPAPRPTTTNSTSNNNDSGSQSGSHSMSLLSDVARIKKFISSRESVVSSAALLSVLSHYRSFEDAVLAHPRHSYKSMKLSQLILDNTDWGISVLREEKKRGGGSSSGGSRGSDRVYYEFSFALNEALAWDDPRKVLSLSLSNTSSSGSGDNSSDSSSSSSTSAAAAAAGAAGGGGGGSCVISSDDGSSSDMFKQQDRLIAEEAASGSTAAAVSAAAVRSVAVSVSPLNSCDTASAATAISDGRKRERLDEMSSYNFSNDVIGGDGDDGGDVGGDDGKGEIR